MTTIAALNGKLTVLQDVSNDIDQHKEYFENSEDQREIQQKHIVDLSNQILVDTKVHTDKHEEQSSYVQKLLAEI